MRQFTTADLNKQVGIVTDAARREPVLITHHRRPRLVMMSVEAYEMLTHKSAEDRQQAFTLDTMPDEIANGLLKLADQYERDASDG